MAGMPVRRLSPELLDQLPASDPEAIGSRRDLARINAIMFQAAIMCRRLRRDLQRPPRRILEIGCGDGGFMLAVLKRMRRHWPGGEIVLLDQQDLVPSRRLGAFADLGWQAETVTADALVWMEQSPSTGFDLVTANLFLHHFAEAGLTRLLAAASRLAPVFVATEPSRNAAALTATGLLRAIGANAVTLHDAAASVRAGFAGQELSRLWPGGQAMTAREGTVGLFTHVFSARSTPPVLHDEI
ncbi:hypothetical protein ASC68_21790 [Devosia sp. Root105]|nr:hypothetical protein ASC68_21790 [Devosia sp. Root105]